MIEEPQRIDLTLEPLDDYLVVQPTEDDAETRGGLILPANLEARVRSGIVTAAGAEAAGISPGDKVLFPRDAGYEVRLTGVQVTVLRRRELIARIHD